MFYRLVGRMEVLTDQETKDMIWRKGDTIFYKKGVADSDYCVLKFTAGSGRYYCNLKIEKIVEKVPQPWQAVAQQLGAIRIFRGLNNVEY